jgi:hypothetical protein
MASIHLEDIDLCVYPHQESTTGVTISGLPGQNTVSHCQIVLSAMKVFRLPAGALIPIGYMDPVTHEVVPWGNAATGPDEVKVDTGIAAATLAPSPNTVQEADFGPGVSSASLKNATRVTFTLHVRTTIGKAVYARASVSVHTLP